MKDEIAQLTNKLLLQIGENPHRDGLIETPNRVARMYRELTAGYQRDPRKIAKLFPSESTGDLITVTKIPFYSLCEHHLVPFYGMVNIGYIPDRNILGLSKFARIVDVFAKRLQVQERMTVQIAENLVEILQPSGLIVAVKAEHLCMSMRGVSKPGSQTYTESIHGIIKDNDKILQRFYHAMRE